MRGRDEESGDFLGPSRSQQRREALDVLKLAETLTALTEAQLSRLPVPESLVPHIREAKRITANIARKRQLAFLAKQMRREDDETLQAIRDALDENSKASRSEVAAMHRVEAWRDRLLEGGDEDLAKLVEMHPDADRQRLRQLVRNTQEERKRGKPPHSYRELFRALRETMLARGGADGDANADDRNAASGDEAGDTDD